MSGNDRNLQIVGAIACAAAVLRTIGLTQATSIHGSPLALQLAIGLNMPAAMLHRFMMRTPITDELVDDLVLFFGVVAVFWLWMFFWFGFLRKNAEIWSVPLWLSVAWAVIIGGYCLYVASDFSAIEIFRAVAASSGLTNAFRSAAVVQWLLTLLWGMFLVGSGIWSGARELKRRPSAVTTAPLTKSARKLSHRKRDRQSHN